MSLPSSGLTGKPMPACCPLRSCSLSSIIKMEEICSPVTSIDLHLTTLRYITEDRTFEPLKNFLSMFNLDFSLSRSHDIRKGRKDA
jgi:hypothetical protein